MQTSSTAFQYDIERLPRQKLGQISHKSLILLKKIIEKSVNYFH